MRSLGERDHGAGVGLVVKELKRGVLYIVSILSLGALFLAYQLRVPLIVDVGSVGDHDVVTNFHDPDDADGVTYRWSSGLSTIHFRGVATWTPVELTIRLNGSRPGGLSSPYVLVVANGHEVGPLRTTDQFETYRLRLAPDMVGVRGDLVIDIHCDAFVPAEIGVGDDERQLGVMVDSLALAPVPGRIPPVLPPLVQSLCLVLAVAGTYLWARQLAISTERSLLNASLLLAAVAALVVMWPARLGLYSQWPPTLLALANVGTILGRSAWSRLTGDRRLPAEVVLDLHFLLLLAVAITAGLYAWRGVWQPLREDRATDFFINYAAATALSEGRNIYDPAALREVSRHWEAPTTTFDFGSLFVTYITPPFHALMLLPLVPLGYEKARFLFLVLSNILLFSSLALILRACDRALHRPPWVLLALLIMLLFHPVYTSLELGQVDFLILFLISLSYWAYLTDRRLIVGPALAMAAMIKLSPAVLLLYFLWKREFTIVAWAAITGVVCMLVSVLVIGAPAVLRFGGAIVPALLKGTAFFQNQSLNGFFSRVFVNPNFYYSLQEFPSLPAARLLALVSSLAILGVVAYLTRPRLGPSALRFPYEFALVIASLLLVSSISWDHYTIWLLPGFVILLHPSLSVRLSRVRYWTVMSCGWCAYLLMIVPTSWYGMALHDYSGAQALQPALALLVSLKVYAVLLLCSSLAFLLTSLDSNQPLGVSTGVQDEGQRVSP